jgi:hypothetical protein
MEFKKWQTPYLPAPIEVSDQVDTRSLLSMFSRNHFHYLNRKPTKPHPRFLWLRCCFIQSA